MKDFSRPETKSKSFRNPYERDRAWSENFLPEIKGIVGPHLLEPSPFEMDCKQATDLIVLRAMNLDIACRVRRVVPGYLERYKDEATIRSSRNNGTKTELQKIVDGWADWMFYGWGYEDYWERCIIHWFLIDLHAWRAHFIRHRDRGLSKLEYGIIPNRDDETEFMWFNVRSFIGDPPLLIAEDSLKDLEKFY